MKVLRALAMLGVSMASAFFLGFSMASAAYGYVNGAFGGAVVCAAGIVLISAIQSNKE